MKEFLRRKLVNIVRSGVAETLAEMRLASGFDINEELQLRARSEAADFALSELKDAKPFREPTALLEWCVRESCLKAEELVLEFGVWKGCSINRIASIYPGKIHGFDSFEGLPEDWRWEYEKGTFSVATLPPVAANVSLWKGWFSETLPRFMEVHSGDVGFAHIDCDLYSSTKDIFENIGCRLRKGSIILFDEYFNYPGWKQGEHKAFLEFITSSGRQFEYVAFCSCNEQVAVRMI